MSETEEEELEDGSQGWMALEEYQEESEGGPEGKKEVQETRRRAKWDNPQARFSHEKMVARDEEDD